jgi:putative nucleotidyltransferase with HDIG domain
MKRRILFVDDEAMVLQGLQRMLRSKRDDWDMQFASGGSEALAALADQPADLVVSDMRMPGMSGAQLLREVSLRYPQTVRFILSGHSDTELVLQCVGTAHQFLSKPCDAETLKTAIARAFALNDILQETGLRQLVTQLASVPSPPAIYNRLREQLALPDASVEKVGRIIGDDPAMTVRILQLVNSAFFGLSRKICSPTEAATLLGMETIKALVLWTHIFSGQSSPDLRRLADEVSRHSLLTAQLARQIIEWEEGDNQTKESAMTAGLLHDVGKLVLAFNSPAQYRKATLLATRERISPWEAESRIFGTTHAEVGAYLLGLWGLPFDLVEAVAFHHAPSRGGNRAVSGLAAVHIADVLQHESQPASRLQQSTLDQDFLESLGLSSRIGQWREALQHGPATGQP